MRRVITFALVVGLTYAGLWAFAPADSGPGPRAAAVHLTARAGRPGFKVVRFAGYTIRVPASWPVYRLDRDPSRCVRYDQHAVYLGQPGANQQCPAHLVGRTAAISIQAAASTPGPASGMASPVDIGDAIGTLPQVGGSVTRDGRQHRGRTAHSQRRGSHKHGARHHRARHHGRGKHQAHPRTPRPRVARHGFDSCTTPSLAAMRAWRRAFSAMAVYIGGVEAGCASPNLTADWVRAVTGLGWALMPTYVGRQASCSSFSVRIRPAHAEAQGQAAALDAIHQAATLGMGRGTPVYYDMEAYHGHRRCKDATLAFLDAWTRTLHAHGYSSGVYSSASSGAENLGWAHRVNGHAIAKPDSMWFGLWDNEQNVRGLPYLLRSWWQGPRRIKQYEGPHRRSLGGYLLDIDSDWVYGAVYR